MTYCINLEKRRGLNNICNSALWQTKWYLLVFYRCVLWWWSMGNSDGQGTWRIQFWVTWVFLLQYHSWPTDKSPAVLTVPCYIQLSHYIHGQNALLLSPTRRTMSAVHFMSLLVFRLRPLIWVLPCSLQPGLPVWYWCGGWACQRRTQWKCKKAHTTSTFHFPFHLTNSFITPHHLLLHYVDKMPPLWMLKFRGNQRDFIQINSWF